MAKTRTAGSQPKKVRAKTRRSPLPAKEGALERRIVAAAHTLGTLVGQAESQWDDWQDQRLQVKAALASVQARASSILSELASGARSMAGTVKSAASSAASRPQPGRKRAARKRGKTAIKTAATRTRR